jgi:hypothetical protein
MNVDMEAPKFDREITRDTVLIAIFGTLWGLMEITVGLTLKGFRLPLSGAILAALSSIIFLTGRFFIPRRGSILLMGGVSAALKIFSVGTVIAGPVMAILTEAFLAEILLIILGINRFSYFITPVILLLYTIVHPFISQGIIFGSEIYSVYLQTLEKFSELFGIDLIHIGLIIAIYAVVHILMGLIAGGTAYFLVTRVKLELEKINKLNENFL